MKQLEFGTAGIRALMGEGEDFLNQQTVNKITQGASDFLLSKNKKTVCISYDNRNNSKLFAYTTARVFAQNGLNVIISKTLMPTPYLSFMVRHFGADFGVMITASHNTREYNGYKVYGEDGCQLTDQASMELKQYIDNAKINNPNSFTYFLKQKKIQKISIKREYLDNVKRLCIKNLNESLKITYSALNGTGGELVKRALEFLKYEVDIVKEQFNPDGDFLSCPNPNPEHEDAFKLAIEYAKANDSDIILATDPDADRVGVMVKTENTYKKLTGNEVGAILTDFLIKNSSIKNPILIRTVVTTPLADQIIKEHNGTTIEVLTGFKYIGEQISLLKEQNKIDSFLLGFEDSIGYLRGDYVRDKDAILGSTLIAQAASFYKKNNKTLVDAINDIYNKYGYFIHKTISYKSDKQRVEFLLNDLRKNPNNPLNINVKSKTDFLLDNTSLPKTNMIRLNYSFGSITIRPSGTEPLIKVYLVIKSTDRGILNEIIGLTNNYFINA